MMLVSANNSAYYTNYTNSTIEEERHDINLHSSFSLLLKLCGVNYIQSLDMAS